jgi:hypothetical protein
LFFEATLLNLIIFPADILASVKLLSIFKKISGKITIIIKKNKPKHNSQTKKGINGSFELSIQLNIKSILNLKGVIFFNVKAFVSSYKG